MATAGVLKGVGDAFSLPTNAEEVSKTVQQATKAAELTEATLAQQLPAHAACQAAHAAANVSMNTLFGQRFEDALKSAGIAAVASTIGSVASTSIGDAFSTQQIDSITHKLLHGITGAVSGTIIDGKEGAVAGVFGALVGEIIAETLLPTQVAPHDHASGNTETGNTKANRTAAASTKAKPTYTDERIAQVHGITRLVVATGALLAGMDEKGITAAVSACTTAIEHNHGATLRKREDSAAASAQDDAEEVETEAAKTATHAADDATTKDADDRLFDDVSEDAYELNPLSNTYDGESDDDVEDISFVDQKGRFVPVHDSAPNSAHAAYLGVDVVRDDAFVSMASASGRMSPTSRDFYYNSERAQTDMEQAILSGDQAAYDEAFARHILWEQTYDDRQEQTQGHRLLANDPRRVAKQAGYIFGGALIGASVLATGGTAAVLGGAGAFALEMTQRDCEVHTVTDALEVGASTALGTTAGMGLKTLFGTSAAVAGAGYMVDSTPMMTEGLVGVGLSGSLGAAVPIARRLFKQSGKTQAGASATTHTTQTPTAFSSSIPPEGCLLFRAQRIDETGKAVTVPVMIAGKARGNIKVPTQSPFLKEGADEAMSAWKQVKEARGASVQQHIDQTASVDRASTRMQLFGTDSVYEFSAQRVGLTNNRQRINSSFAGKTYRFDESYLENAVGNAMGTRDKTLIRECISNYRAQHLDGISSKVLAEIQDVRALQNKYPNGAQFTGEGFLDLAPYASEKVKITIIDGATKDFSLADKVAGYTRAKPRPKNMTWHHVDELGNMQLVPRDLHDAIRHTGGVARNKEIVKGKK